MNRLLSSSFALLFSITTTAFPVEPVKGRIEIRGESGDQVLEASRVQPVIQEAPQFGSLLIQTVPVNCVISIPSLKVDQSPKIMNDWRISNIPAGTYSVTFAALDKTLQSDVRIRPGKSTVLLINFLLGRVENKSAWADITGQAADSSSPVKPMIEGSLDHPLTPEETLAWAEADCASIQQAIVELDTQLNGSHLGLDNAHQLLKQRLDCNHALVTATLARANAAEALELSRLTRFQADYAKFREIVAASDNLPDPLKSSVTTSAWHDLVQQWAVAGAGEVPAQLYWHSGKAHVVTKPAPGQGAMIPDLEIMLVWIAPGKFIMGSPNNESGRDTDEGPMTEVTLAEGFWLGEYELTQGQWQKLRGNNPSHFTSAGEAAPVEQVSWDEAMEFCQQLTEREIQAGRLPAGYSYSLPTEAQWEYAGRAGTHGAYAGKLDALAWYVSNSVETTHPGGKKKPNAWGLHDMAGNVWEWCLDWKGPYPGKNVTDYRGPSTGSLRVYRGGSWADAAFSCRSALRYGGDPANRSNQIGFRLCLSRNPNKNNDAENSASTTPQASK